MDQIQQGWFSEKSTLWPGQAFSLEVDKVLHTEKSEFQDILVFQSKTYGTVLVLDGVIQLTQRDQFAYQEMIAHLPLFSHKNPEKVLIIGGGDGAVIAQVIKHASVKEVHLCEIDGKVIEASKKFFPEFLPAWNDPRVQVHLGDGLVFLDENKLEVDVIIVDSSDPVGPAESLFTKAFFERMKKSLRPSGVICTQAECVWLHLDIIKKVLDSSRELYKYVDYGFTTIPTYPSGQIGFMLCSDERSSKEPTKTPAEALLPDNNALLYYSSEVHRAAFVLPEFARKHLQ
eukprot:TRINITY_DN277_c0_g1_i2.p1 TRINITY_DN277_c0_g1~~TRINITY_DN277_c0_g1_i2.p1  ORF type:complete len:287 (-),score=48.38 TRINITY_DN277_c0_g1_i2:111-971(-)